MSDFSKQMIICPHCHRTALFNIWNSINTKTHPQTKNQVRDLSLFKFRCPYCEKTELVRYPFLYHQMENGFMIFYQPEEKELAETKKMLEENSTAEITGDDSENRENEIPSVDSLLQNTLANYRYRIVRSHEEFLEKLAITDAGLDDRLVELTKVVLGAQVERQLSEYGFRVKGARFIFEETNHEMKLVFLDKNSSQTATVSFDQHVASVYNQLIDRYSASLEGPHKKDSVIDWNWASEVLKEEH